MDPVTGLPQVLQNGVPYWNTVTVALYGLQEINLWHFHQGPHLERAIKAADWLVGWQEKGGGWPYLVPFTYLDGQTISAPWLAAQAQGNALSLLVRVYKREPQAKYLGSARRGCAALTRLTAKVKGHTLLEGFPTAKPTITLEDLQLALLGIYDLSTYDALAGSVFTSYAEDYFSALALWGSPQGPLYDLSYLNGTPPIFDAGSATFNANLLALLARVAKDPVAEEVATKWHSQIGT